jgi:hypothetical protein
MFLERYQQPDPNTILAVMNEPSKLGEQWEVATGRRRVSRAPPRRALEVPSARQLWYCDPATSKLGRLDSNQRSSG